MISDISAAKSPLAPTTCPVKFSAGSGPDERVALPGLDTPRETLSNACFAELCAQSCFSFLQGASQPEQMVQRAATLGLTALGLCDWDGIYGMVRAFEASKQVGTKLIVGACVRVESADSPLFLLVRDQTGYENLCKLLTLAHGSEQKTRPHVSQNSLASCANGLFGLLGAPYDASVCALIADAFGSLHARCEARPAAYLAVHRHLVQADRAYQHHAMELSQRFGLPIVATGRPLFHVPEQKPIADVLYCIRNKVTLDEAGVRLLANSEACLSSPRRMVRLFWDHPQWVKESVHIANQCHFSLSELSYRFPSDTLLEPGETPDDALFRLVNKHIPWRYPKGAPHSVLEQITKELALIKQLNVAPYFLSVYDIVQIAREKKILCQGRGSAANSAVCFVLGITAVDPARSHLLFERFMSKERSDPPDIDVDFEHERREEVIQEIYRRYGRERAAMVSEVISYRGKSALRDVGKAFGLSLEQVGLLSKTLGHTREPVALAPERLRSVGLDPSDGRVARVLRIAQQIQGFPRHLSIHVGGFVLSAEPLSRVAPVEPARMPGRTIIPWDKDDLDALGFFKVDVLSLGMLTCVRKTLGLVMPELEPQAALAQVPPEDPTVYERFCKADTVGVFQIESRAQMSMLPRLAPRCFYDLVVEVALVRPGPLQGGMVHPYLARRTGKQKVDCPHPSLWPVLERTLGVPLFQEQVMQIAMIGAGYTPGQADQLRRDMAAWKRHGRLYEHRDRLLHGFMKKGISREFSERLFKQIQGFGEYGFPESHAASFALIAYVSGWLKTHYPAAFCASLLNSQPMGFYSPSSLVRDAQQHGVEVLPVCVVQSDWDCTVGHGQNPALRLGLRMIRGLGKAAAQRILQARADRAFVNYDDFLRRTNVRNHTVSRLAEAGALQQLVAQRRNAIWKSRAPRVSGLFGDEPLQEPEVTLPPLSSAEQLVLDYNHVGLSLHDHPMRYLRQRICPTVQATALNTTPHHTEVAVAGVVINRQRPGTAKGTVFVTLEDETGTINLVLWALVFEQYRHTALHAAILMARGKLDKREGQIHVIAQHLERIDRGTALQLRSRDFH